MSTVSVRSRARLHNVVILIIIVLVNVNWVGYITAVKDMQSRNVIRINSHKHKDNKNVLLFGSIDKIFLSVVIAIHVVMLTTYGRKCLSVYIRKTTLQLYSVNKNRFDLR